MATIGNYSGKSLRKGVIVHPHDFFNFSEDFLPRDSTQATSEEIEALLKDPKLVNRFKKNG